MSGEPMVVMAVSDLKEVIRQVLKEERPDRSSDIHVEKLYTVEEAAELLKRHPKTIYKIKHRIGFIREGSGIRFKASALQDYQERHQI